MNWNNIFSIWNGNGLTIYYKVSHGYKVNTTSSSVPSVKLFQYVIYENFKNSWVFLKSCLHPPKIYYFGLVWYTMDMLKKFN